MKHKIKTVKGKQISLNFLGDGNYEVSYLCGLGLADYDTLSFYKDDDVNLIANIECGILLVKNTLKQKITDYSSKCIVFTENPYHTFINVVNDNYSFIFTDEQLVNNNNKISKSAYVESDVVLGKNNIIYPNTTIYNGTTIGNYCKIQSGTVVAGSGMTYEKIKGDFYTEMSQIGNVIIEDHVDIGCNSTILRGILESTIIRKGAKIGNFINIGHNCDIGENAYIAAGTMIGGASKIGKNSWIAPGVSIRDHITIGENCTIGVGSVVVKDTEPNGIYYGNPAKLIKKKQ